MSRRYWLPILAVVGLILSGQVNAQAVGNDARGQPSASQGQPKPKADPPPAVSAAVQNDIHRIAGALESANDEQASAGERQRAQQNLDDQNRMAFWASAMFWVGLAEAVITACGVFLVYWTLVHTRRAANAARDAVAEAARATEVASKALIASNRAWVKPEIGLGSPLIIYPDDNETGASVSVSFRLKNIGNAPAIEIGLHAWLLTHASGEPTIVQLRGLCDEVKKKPRNTGLTLFPDEQFPADLGLGGYSIGVTMGREDIIRSREISEINMPLFIVGCVDYAFPADPTAHHQTRFAYALHANGGAEVAPRESMYRSDSLRLTDMSTMFGRYAD